MPSACNRFQLELLQSIDPESLYLRSSELYLSFLQLAREIHQPLYHCQPAAEGTERGLRRGRQIERYGGQ